MLNGILADNDVRGYLRAILRILERDEWLELWNNHRLPVRSFAEFMLDRSSPDRAVWIACQTHEVLLVTANRNQDGPDSLEATIRRDSRDYTETVAIRLLDIIINIDSHLGAGRIYLP